LEERRKNLWPFWRRRSKRWRREKSLSRNFIFFFDYKRIRL